jgi:hypothetical protein
VPTGAAAPRHARPIVVVFTAMLVVCALGPFNLWPFSNWQLFSHLRTDQQSGWDAVAIDSSGHTRDDPIASLPSGHSGFASTMAAFAHRSPSARDAICDAWLNAAAEKFGPSTRLLKIYRLQWLLSDRHGDRPPPRHRTLVLSCSERGA